MEIKDLIKKNTVFHCDTEEKANELLKKADQFGYRWCFGDSFINCNNWESYKQDTCYDIATGEYANLDFCKKEKYKIIEYKLDNENKIDKDIILLVGDKITYNNFENKTKSLVIQKSGRKLEDYECDCEKISKIERPVKYETIYEVKEDILDKEEKEYLSNVIKPYRKNIIYIEKDKVNYNKYYINIIFKNMVDNIQLPYFKNENMYKGMKNNRTYTLEELGL